ncbi:hypothetical protein [Streptosporangium sp. NPDC051022]|uniref:hypothetical protein n=1 Tax=Streptosporangium sp. NPDC051022 TaxID=3155752 RepID=UPI003447BE19
MIVIPAVAGSLLLATGCGVEHSATPPGAAGGAVAVPVSVSRTVAPRVEPTGKDAPKPVKPEGHTVNPRKVSWLSAKPSKDGRSLRVVWWSGVEPCHVLDHVTVKQTARRVTVTLWEGESDKVQNVACIDIAIKKSTIVKLKAPLGKRKVVDGARH